MELRPSQLRESSGPTQQPICAEQTIPGFFFVFLSFYHGFLQASWLQGVPWAEMAEAETAEPFLVVRPRKFTLEERKAAIRTIIGGDTGDHGNYKLQ